ncbi:heavy-metal-associated domain-containing protein [Autumnicola musiva]|jgi:copper chaperone CopZ|uniref:Heavy metal-associated domain-containing protein n=1 Tax=Autumnicola musiva TaxID=3075589 RepID=A0ABU3D1X6_9FLAO|nr:heavy metal-associated domain-containing protein [Zunongwangia sp. F117]MDT0675512.1 heavy metal-associated domain-containing protein [Zunongwangia sp. F117]
MKSIALIIVVMVVGSFSSNAQIQKVDQEVFGMDCAPCAYGLERGLKKMDGLESVKVSLNDGKAYLNLANNNNLSLKQIQEEVKKNGFSAKNAEIVIKGTLVEQDGNYAIRTGKETFTIAEATSTNLYSELKPGVVKVKGIVKDEEDGELSTKWEIKLTEIL